MPQRMNIKKVESPEIQGEGSFVKLRSLTLKEDTELATQRDAANTQEGKVEVTTDLMAKVVVDWNWVDEEGNPLPLPKDDPSVVMRLTGAEAAFISQAAFQRQST